VTFNGRPHSAGWRAAEKWQMVAPLYRRGDGSVLHAHVLVTDGCSVVATLQIASPAPTTSILTVALAVAATNDASATRGLLALDPSRAVAARGRTTTACDSRSCRYGAGSRSS